MHALARRLIRKHFADGLSVEREARLRAHLRSCASCRAEYDQVAAMLRVAADRVPTRTESSRLRAAVLGGLDPQPGSPGTGQALAARRLTLLRLSPALAGALLALITYGLFQLRPGDTGPQERGGSSGASPLVDVQVFAVREGAGGFLEPRIVAEDGALHLDEYIQFRYRNHTTDLRYLYLLGLDERRVPLDYFPRPEADRSIPVGPAESMRAIPRSIRLSRRHQPGALRVFALFSMRPLERAEVHRAVARLRGASGAPSNSRAPSAELPGNIDLGRGVVQVVRRFEVKSGT